MFAYSRNIVVNEWTLQYTSEVYLESEKILKISVYSSYDHVRINSNVYLMKKETVTNAPFSIRAKLQPCVETMHQAVIQCSNLSYKKARNTYIDIEIVFLLLRHQTERWSLNCWRQNKIRHLEAISISTLQRQSWGKCFLSFPFLLSTKIYKSRHWEYCKL
jgi:hypothetical protein